MFFDMYDEDIAGWRPASLAEPPGPQERVPQRTVEPMLETFVPVPSLDVPVPQTVDRLEDVLEIVDLLRARAGHRCAQDLVPSSTFPCRPPRHADGAEQLVGVP